MRDFPAVRELVEVVRASLPAHAGAAAAASAAALHIWTESRQTVRRLSEGLAAWIDQAGQGIAAGLAECQLAPQMAMAGRTLDASQPAALRWQIPLDPITATLTIELRPVAQGAWQLVLRSEGLSPDASLEVTLAGRESDLSDRLSAWEGQPISLEPGTWTLVVADQGFAWEVPLQVGVPPV
jgi:hypothetical protein